MRSLRRKIARRIWDFARWLYADPKFKTTEGEQGWELSYYFECDEATANAVFERTSDAFCGVDHHPLDPCPGPVFVGGMHPANTDEILDDEGAA